jgi:hypothetical protein
MELEENGSITSGASVRVTHSHRCFLSWQWNRCNDLWRLQPGDGLVTPLHVWADKLRVSFYADDAAVFVKPVKEEVAVVAQILQLFGRVSGLLTTQAKCAVYPVHCDSLNLEEVMESFQCPVASFPCTYLGLPLHLRQLRRVDVQPLIDKLANRLPSWKGRFINRAGRLKLLNSVLTSIPTYFLTMFQPKKWLIQKLDKVRRGFLWAGAEQASGGQCLVKWKLVKRPKSVGGLGVLDFEVFSRALRQRWLWFQFTDPDRPWGELRYPETRSTNNCQGMYSGHSRQWRACALLAGFLARWVCTKRHCTQSLQARLA